MGAYGSLIGDNERFSGKTMEQNLSEQHLYVTDEGMNQEDELMEWEPVEDEKILSHVRLLNASEADSGSFSFLFLSKPHFIFPFHCHFHMSRCKFVRLKIKSFCSYTTRKCLPLCFIL